MNDRSKFVTLLCLMCALLWACVPRQNFGPEPLDHFLCYFAVPPGASVPAYPQIELDDQFSRSFERFGLFGGTVRFCNPVEKRHGRITTPISDTDHHLLAIQLVGDPDVAEGKVRVTNQFFPELGQTLIVSKSNPTFEEFLMVPTRKHEIDPTTSESHQAPSNRLDHFKCYPAVSVTTPNTTVSLRDQWHSQDEQARELAVGDVALLCNPTAKKHGTGDTVPARYRNDHLVCYTVEGAAEPRMVSVSNQFSRPMQTDRFDIVRLEWLCVPSTKERMDGWWGTAPG